MSYIRTKDKIYGFIPNIVSSIEYDDEIGAYSIYYFDENKGEHLERDDKGGHSMDSVWKEDIVKQADTIEELCDYWDFYDLLDNEYKVKPINLYSVGVMRASLKGKTTSDIKLAIRTYKGLIYVAKMNDKGELELL